MTKKTQNAMWGGRFAAGPDAIMEAINASISFDQRLAAQDIAGSRAHAAMLAAQGIITDSDAEGDPGRPAHGVVRDRGRGFSVFGGLGRHSHECRIAAQGLSLANRRGGCTPRGRATIRWRWISGCGSATRPMRPLRASPACKRRCWIRQRPGPIGSCPASPICKPRSR